MALKKAAKNCYDYQQELLEAGLDLNSLESSVTAGLQNSLFHDDDDLAPEPLEDGLVDGCHDNTISALPNPSGGLEALLAILNQNQEAAPSVDPGNMDHLDESTLVISQINPYVLSPVTMQPTVDGAEASNGNE